MIAAMLALAAATQSTPLSSEGPLAISNVVVTPERASRFNPVEISFTMTGTWSNPLDPSQLEVAANVVGAQDSVSSIHGFLYQDYSSEVVGNAERLTATGPLKWMIRFSPWNIGGYGVFLRISDRLRTITPEKIGVRVERGDGGFVQTREKSRYFFVGDTSRIWMGVTLSPAGSMGTHAWAASLDRLKTEGANYCRVILDPAALGGGFQSPIEYALAPEKGMLQSAWMIERLLRMARDRGIYVCLSFVSARQLDRTGGWLQSSYSLTNGGPCAAPEDFFSNLRARLMFKRSMRYLISRIQNFDNLAGIELSSGVEAPSYWTQEIVNEVVGEHTYLIPVSTAPAAEDTWRIEYVGYATTIARFGSSPSQTSANVAAAVQATIEQTKKPVLVQMVGSPPEPAHAVSAFWTALACGAASGAIWSETRGVHTYAGPRSIVDRIEFGKREFVPFTAPRGSGEPAYGIADKNGALIFVRSASTANAEVVELALPADGNYRVRCFNARTGEQLADVQVTISKSQGALSLPASSQELVCVLEKR